MTRQLDDPALARLLSALELAKSPYLPPFLALRGSIQQEAARAACNLSFLAALEEPCQRLAAARAADVPGALPAVLDALRIVWTLSPSLSTPQYFTALLRKVSSAVINCCRAGIDVAAVFGGTALPQQEAVLQQCLHTAAAWRAAYEEAAARVSAVLVDRPWTFPLPTIFAHVEAFAQRCCDLLEVCAAQRQFAADVHAATALAGPKAPKVNKALADLQASFAGLMHR